MSKNTDNGNNYNNSNENLDNLSSEERETVRQINEYIQSRTIAEQVEIHQQLARIMAMLNAGENILCVFDNSIELGISLALGQSKRDVFSIFDAIVYRTINSIVGRGGATQFDPDNEWFMNSQDPIEVADEVYRKADIQLTKMMLRVSSGEQAQIRWLMQYVNEWHQSRIEQYKSEREKAELGSTHSGSQAKPNKEDIIDSYPIYSINQQIILLYNYLTENDIVSDISIADVFKAVETADFSTFTAKIQPRRKNAFDSTLYTFFDNVIVTHISEMSTAWRNSVTKSIGSVRLGININKLAKAESNRINEFRRKLSRLE